MKQSHNNVSAKELDETTQEEPVRVWRERVLTPEDLFHRTDEASRTGWFLRQSVTASGLEWVTWHDLRHTFASRLAMNGQAEGTIAALLRHSTTALVRRYAHLSQSHLKAAVEGVAGFGKTATEPQQPTAQEPKPEPISIGTVTETATAGSVEEKEAV